LLKATQIHGPNEAVSTIEFEKQNKTNIEEETKEGRKLNVVDKVIRDWNKNKFARQQEFERAMEFRKVM
jgi:hypothetical protein